MILFSFYPAAAADPLYPGLAIPQPGDHSLAILSPTLIELSRVNTKPPGGPLDSWDWINGAGDFAPPDLSSIKVIVDGETNAVAATGFKRRPFYAPLGAWDLRIGNFLYLQLNNPIAAGQAVQVINDGTLWPTNMTFAAVADPLRFNPAIHVNQEGYLPSFPKKAMVGHYLGSLGELAIPAATFLLVNADTGATVHEGALTLRPDVGYLYSPAPYQQVYEADFTGFDTPGEYRVVVPGMGGSVPFRIDPGVGMNFARTYALGLFHQRSGFNVAMPFTRFTHAADHLAPAGVPVDGSAPFVFTWALIATYAAEVNGDNPPQTAPLLTSPAAQLYPFVNTGPLEVSGGHFEAGDYNRVTYNAAQQVHVLMFAADSLLPSGAPDNLGIPESGDGISDVMQEAKWEADFIARMQDADGGFYYSLYPQFREYESDVLPENGDPEVVWPKNTAATAAAVAALAQCASSPGFKLAYPQAASNYLEKARLGWQFLTNAIANHGFDGAYQRIQHFGDGFTHRDELAWAACELFLATGDPQYRTQLESWFPDPTHPDTTRWGWWRMYASYGNAIRAYATAVSSGRLQAFQLNAAYLAKCIDAITNCGNDNLQWSRDNAYGSSFPEPTKWVRGAGWYFSAVQAFDLVVAQQFNPNPAYIDAILANLNYEAGCNPLNQPFLTGIGRKRQREVVDQYSNNDRHVLPKIGIPIGNLQEGFRWTFTYGFELSPLCFPHDGKPDSPHPFYDRWCDFFNVSTEGSTTDTTRGLAVAAWLAMQTPVAGQPWRSTNATIHVPGHACLPGQPVSVSLDVAGPDLSGARVTWEALGQEPAFGTVNHTFTPVFQEGAHWIEAEVHWPDGRRAFATGSINVSINAPPVLSDATKLAGGGFSFQLAGAPHATYVIQASANLTTWQAIATNTLPAGGVLSIADPLSGTFSRRYYRAVRIP